MRAKLIALAAALALFGQLQCAAACDAEFCAASAAPPCHRHRAPAPDRCAHRTIVAQAKAPQTAAAPAFPAAPAVIAVAALPKFEKQPPALTVACASPPGRRSLSSIVLRI